MSDTTDQRLPPILPRSPFDAPVDGFAVQTDPRGQHVVSIFLSWAIIIGMVGLHFALNAFAPIEIRSEATKVDLLQVNMMAKFLVGLQSLSEGRPVPFEVQKIGAEDFPEPHWCEAIMLNEVADAHAALDRLREIKTAVNLHQIPLTESQEQISELLTRIFTDYAKGDWTGSSVSAAEKTLLISKLGFCGTLVQTPAKSPLRDQRKQVETSAVRFTLVAFGLGMLLVLLLIGGSIGLFVLLGALLTRKLKFRFVNGAGHAHVYGETFAIWLVWFTLLQLIVGEIVPEKLLLIGLGGGFFLSLAALIWPIVRGIPWSQVRRDIGWVMGGGVLKEVACGVVSYICMTPIILCAFIVVVILANFLGTATLIPFGQLDGKNAPSHPIVFELAKNDPMVVLTALLLACVAAPIIEETMFRGVLYRHLRDSTVWFRTFASVVISAGVNSLVFAAIHPQGLLGVPVLGALAFGFSIVREWRGSLIAPMVMHAINNGTMTALLLLVLGSLGS